MLRFDGLASDVCARMPFANVGMAWHAFGMQHLCALSSVGDIGLRSKAMDGRSIATYNADVVQHGRLFNKLEVEAQFG